MARGEGDAAGLFGGVGCSGGDVRGGVCWGTLRGCMGGGWQRGRRAAALVADRVAGLGKDSGAGEGAAGAGMRKRRRR